MAEELREQLAADLWRTLQQTAWERGVVMLDSDRAAFRSALTPLVEQYAATVAAAELRAAAEKLAFTPLLQRESGVVTEYTKGMQAAGRLIAHRADALEAGQP